MPRLFLKVAQNELIVSLVYPWTSRQEIDQKVGIELAAEAESSSLSKYRSELEDYITTKGADKILELPGSPSILSKSNLCLY